MRTTSEIVERLNELAQNEAECGFMTEAYDLRAAADRLAELERENARLREAVQKIHNHLSDYIDAKKTVDVSIAVAFETGRAALAGSGEK